MAMFCCGADALGKTVREALDVLLATEYCWTAAMDGMGLESALRGRTPVSDDGVFDVPEEEWLPVLVEMTEEELEACKRDTAEDIAGIRRWEAAGERRDNSDDEGTRYLWAADRRVKSRRHKLMKMVVCLQYAEGGTEQVLDILERVGLESPPEFDLSLRVAISMVNKACRDGEYTKCLELGRRYRKLNGPGSKQELNLACEFGEYGIPKLLVKRAKDEGIRYLLEFGETVGNVEQAKVFDRVAKDSIPGWVGSVQRRRLATRFPDEPLPCVHYCLDGQQVEEIIESMVPLMLNRQAAAELAAQESELTDLRQVYGDWTKEKAEE
jgi:hypothetical protein